MIELAAATRSLVVERQMPHPREKIWRALTHGPLIEEWLMQNDFQPVVGHRFNFRSTPIPLWNGVTDCEVLAVEPNRRLAYSWNASGDQAPDGLKTIVTWTLTPCEGGTLVRMEQSGFRPQDEAAAWAAAGRAFWCGSSKSAPNHSDKARALASGGAIRIRPSDKNIPPVPSGA